MDEAVGGYIEAIAAAHRPLFDRVHRVILDVHPDVAVSLAYRIPTYTVRGRRLHVGVWKHGVSIYGWSPGREHTFLSHHPQLRTGRGTIQLRPDTAVTDAELADLIRTALDPEP